MIIRSTTLRQWVNANLKEYLADIVNHGIDAGYPGITYYSDTSKLYDRFKDEIFEMLEEDANDQGITIPELIARFNEADQIYNSATFENLLVWYAVERIAYQETDKAKDKTW